MGHVRYGKFIVLPFSDFQECIRKTKTVSAKPILPKTMSKRSIELFNHLYDNYQDKIQWKGKKSSTNSRPLNKYWYRSFI